MTTQVSRPMIIALLGTVLFAAVWFVVLRPKSATESTGTAPAAQTPTPTTPSSSSASGGGTSLTDRPAQARSAVESANSQIDANKAQADAAANGTAATPGTAAPSSSSSAATSSPSSSSSSSTSSPSSSAAPASEKTVVISPEAPAGERAVLQALADDKVVVLLFWDSKAADDRQARRAVRSAVAGRKNVEVATIPASQVGKYEAITGGITVEQTPTTMIIGPSMKAITIGGLVDELEIEQAIAKLRAKR